MASLSSAPGAMPTAFPIRDPFALIIADHHEFKKYLDTLGQMVQNGTKSDLENTIRQFVAKVSAHTSMEERALHDLYRKHLGPEGAHFFDESLEYDDRDKASLDVLEAKSTLENRELLKFTLTGLHKNLLEHIALEENVYFPKLKASLSQKGFSIPRPLQPALRASCMDCGVTEQQLDDLYNELVRLRESGTLPSHPHPLGPSGPIGAKIVHPIVAMVDKVADRMAGKQSADFAEHK